ncbi:Cytochrome bd ubiquinol oxidase, subunit I [Candidatus Magnetoovum chiemensis]|nr:Cytochrome bd ubiquinol oxidase, subunit I [Candidatus Magnetoovum chiemensis]
MGGLLKKQLFLWAGLIVAAIGIVMASKAGVDYKDFPVIGSRNVVWIFAQTMLLFAAFILAVPVFVLIIEIVGYATKNERFDKLAKDFARLLPLSYSMTAGLGGLFTFISYNLFPKYMNYMTDFFKVTFYVFIVLVVIESAFLYFYWTTWDKLKGDRKMQHIMLGIGLNVLGALVMMTANIWGSFQLSPGGVDASGLVVNLKAAIFNHTFWPLNIHRFIANVSFGGFICAAYAAYKYLSTDDPQQKAHYDWMGYTGTFIGVATMIFLPFAGYYFGMEIYSFNAQMGITFMGGALSKIWLLQAIVIAVVFIGTCYYLWIGLDRIPGSEKYKKALPYLLWILILTFAVWATPRAWVASLEDMAGGVHPIFGTVGVMAPKIAAVNIAILGVIVTFLINRRAGKVIPRERNMYMYIQWGILAAVVIVNIIVLLRSYQVDSAVRIRMSIYTFIFMVIAIALIYIFDAILLKGTTSAGEIKWGAMPARSQYALITVAVSNVWAMALLGYGRAAARLNWHVYGVLEDTSRYNGLPSLGRATLVISGITLLFLVLIGVVFKFTATEDEKGGDVS